MNAWDIQNQDVYQYPKHSELLTPQSAFLPGGVLLAQNGPSRSAVATRGKTHVAGEDVPILNVVLGTLEDGICKLLATRPFTTLSPAIPAFLHIPIFAGWNLVIHLRPISTAVPSLLTPRASCVEAGLAGDRVVVHVEVAVVDHVVTFIVIRWAVDRPEAGIGANPTGLPETVRGKRAATRFQRSLSLLDGVS